MENSTDLFIDNEPVDFPVLFVGSEPGQTWCWHAANGFGGGQKNLEPKTKNFRTEEVSPIEPVRKI